MHKEIGSEFWIDNRLSFDEDELPMWLNQFGSVILTTSGRGALSLLLDNVKPIVKIALLPSYICESVILPFEHAGYELIYYDLDKNLNAINLEFINEVTFGIFFHMGYFGFSTNKMLSDTIIKLKSKSVIIIEDVTHTLFSQQSKPIISDFIIGSIRKWIGIPSGGFLASESIINYQLNDTNFEFVNIRRTSLQKKFEYINSNNELLKSNYLKGFNKAEKILNEDIRPYRIDNESEARIKNLDYKKLQHFRQNNYCILLSQLRNTNGIEVLFDDLESGVTPMFFPILVKSNRDVLRQRLIETEVYCPVHWPIPAQVKGNLNSTTKSLYDSILSIPCDQRYHVEDMWRIVNEILSIIKE